MRFCVLFVVLAFVPDRPNPRPVVETKPLQEQILGEWQVIKHFTGGRDDNRPTLIWSFTREAMQHVNLESGEKRPGGKFPYALDVTRNPAVITFPASKFAGILKVEGDLLTVCLHATQNDQPPADFVSPANTSTTLLQARRLKN